MHFFLWTFPSTSVWLKIIAWFPMWEMRYRKRLKYRARQDSVHTPRAEPQVTDGMYWFWIYKSTWEVLKYHSWNSLHQTSIFHQGLCTADSAFTLVFSLWHTNILVRVASPSLAHIRMCPVDTDQWQCWCWRWENNKAFDSMNGSYRKLVSTIFTV